MKKQKALEDFLNDSVEMVENDLFKWHGRHYQIMARTVLHHKGLRADHFIKHKYSGIVYYIREMSKDLLKKYYFIKTDY